MLILSPNKASLALRIAHYMLEQISGWGAGKRIDSGGHPLKAGQVFLCIFRSESGVYRPEILRLAQDDRQKKNSRCPALSGYP